MHRIKLNDRMSFPTLLSLNEFIDPDDMVRAWADLWPLDHTPLQPAVSEEDLTTLYKDYVTEKFDTTRTTYQLVTFWPLSCDLWPLCTCRSNKYSGGSKEEEEEDGEQCDEAIDGLGVAKLLQEVWPITYDLIPRLL